MCDCDKKNQQLEAVRQSAQGNDYSSDLSEAMLRTIDLLGVRADAIGRPITTLIPIPGSSAGSGPMFARLTVEPSTVANTRYPLYAPPRPM